MLHKQDNGKQGTANAQGWQVLDSETAFQAIYTRFWKQLFGMAYSRLNDKQEAEDFEKDLKPY